MRGRDVVALGSGIRRRRWNPALRPHRTNEQQINGDRRLTRVSSDVPMISNSSRFGAAFDMLMTLPRLWGGKTSCDRCRGYGLERLPPEWLREGGISLARRVRPGSGKEDKSIQLTLPYDQIRSTEVGCCSKHLQLKLGSFKVIEPAASHPTLEFETLDTGMEPLEEIRRGRVRDCEVVEDEGVEVWENTVE